MAERTAPPSRALLVATLAVVVAFTVLRVMTAATLDLRTDEAYYWSWAEQYVLSYLDQPPMVAWFERLGIALFGNVPLGPRFAQLLVLPLIQLLLADIARRRTGSWNAALFVVLAMECTLNYGFFAIVVEPNLPLLLFTSLMLWALVRLDETGDGGLWLLAGLGAGLALASKFLVVFVLPGVLLFVLLSPRLRRGFATAWPYAAALLALLLFSPVLIWNLQHGWAAFAFQSERLGSGGGGSFLRFAMYEALYVGPLLLLAVPIGGLVLLWRGAMRGNAFDLGLAAMFLLPLGYLAWRSMDMQINQSWAWFLWPIGIVGLANALPWGRTPRRIGALIVLIGATGLPLVGAFFYHATADGALWLGKGDPLGQDAGFDDLSVRVLAAANANDAGWIATSDYRLYAALNWHIGRQLPVVMINERARFLDFTQPDAASLAGRALYVHEGAPSPLLAGASLVPLAPLPAMWRGVEMRSVSVDLLDGFVPELDPASGSPAYVAAP